MGAENKNINYERINKYADTIISRLYERYEVRNNEEIIVFLNRVEERKNGKNFSLAEHVRGMLFSFLSSQTKWEDKSRKISEGAIDFLSSDGSSGFNIIPNVELISKMPAVDLMRKFRKAKCGNKQIYIQMHALKDNIDTFMRWERDHKSVDGFFEKKIGGFISPDPKKVVEIVKILADSDNEDKLWAMGIPLVCEYLRNVGVDLPKPDRHILRIFSVDRLGFLNKQFIEKGENNSIRLESDVFEVFDILNEKTKKTRVDIDVLFWDYCADKEDTSKAICTKQPNCKQCIISEFCEY